MGRSGTSAVVLGAGMAGLLAARVASESYDSVTVVDRDRLPDHPAQRKGVPQGRHLHSFLTRGTGILGELFPGILDELAAAGAVVIDNADLSGRYARGFPVAALRPGAAGPYPAGQPAGRGVGLMAADETAIRELERTLISRRYVAGGSDA